MKKTKLLFGILSLTLGTLLQTQAQYPFTNGLVAYYPFSGNANDVSGNVGVGRNPEAIDAGYISFNLGSCSSLLSKRATTEELFLLNNFYRILLMIY